jgi:hypothetical protein
MPSNINDDQKAPIVALGADDQGNLVPGPIASLAVVSSDPTIFTVDSTDPANPVVVTTGKLGTAQLQASAQKPDGTTITGTLDVTVMASGLATISIALGTAVAR